MLKKVALCALCGLFASACVVVDDDDETSTTNSSISSSASATNGSASTSSGSGGETEDTTDPSTTTADATTSAGGSSGGSGSACGWGATGQSDVDMGYVCDGDGADPDGTFEMGCPADFELSVGGACIQEEVELTGVGCCDSNGDVWFCEDDGSGPRLNTQACG